MANNISIILSWNGFRTMAAWFINKIKTQIQTLWATAASDFINSIAQSTRNKFDEVQVGLIENIEVLAPAMKWGQDAAGSPIHMPYSGTPSWDFTEEGEYQLGSTCVIGSDTYPCPSLITDTEGNQHVVYPVWGWLADGGYAFRPATITFRHNASYKGGDLDSHEMKGITLSGSAEAGETITGLQTATAVKVGQFGQFETTVEGVTKPWPCIVTSVVEPASEGDPYTFSLLSVSEASGEVTNLQLYQKYVV